MRAPKRLTVPFNVHRRISTLPATPVPEAVGTWHTFTPYIIIFTDARMHFRQLCETLFRKADADGSGFIDVPEMLAL